MAREICWHTTPNRMSRHNLICKTVPPPGPSSAIDRSGVNPMLCAFAIGFIAIVGGYAVLLMWGLL